MGKLTVALLYNLKQNAPHEGGVEEPWDVWNELDSERTVTGIEGALRAGGYDVIPLEGDVNLLERLQKTHVDIAFNTCEGHRGGSREAQVPAILDMLGVPYTGSGVMTLALALDKPMSKRVLAFYGLPTPAFQTLITGYESLDPRLKFPLFVKPSREGSGIGITAKSVCRNDSDLREQVRSIIRDYRQPALVEEYVEGRELTIGLLGNILWSTNGGQPGRLAATHVVSSLTAGGTSPGTNGNGHGRRNRLPTVAPATLRVFPPLEVDLSPCPEDQAGLYTSVIKGKMYEVPKYLCPAPTTKAMRAKLERLAVGAFAALECCDFARVDVRIRAETGEPTILEVNPLAGLQEGISDIVMEAGADGLDYPGLINGILEAALARYGMT